MESYTGSQKVVFFAHLFCYQHSSIYIHIYGIVYYYNSNLKLIQVTMKCPHYNTANEIFINAHVMKFFSIYVRMH